MGGRGTGLPPRAQAAYPAGLGLGRGRVWVGRRVRVGRPVRVAARGMVRLRGPLRPLAAARALVHRQLGLQEVHAEDGRDLGRPGAGGGRRGTGELTSRPRVMLPHLVLGP